MDKINLFNITSLHQLQLSLSPVKHFKLQQLSFTKKKYEIGPNFILFMKQKSNASQITILSFPTKLGINYPCCHQIHTKKIRFAVGFYFFFVPPHLQISSCYAPQPPPHPEPPRLLRRQQGAEASQGACREQPRRARPGGLLRDHPRLLRRPQREQLRQPRPVR
jgi:hypothetical protein